jgi:hypothetical protein
MNEKPMLFSSPMIRAILDGTKKQTRRVVTLPKDHSWGDLFDGQVVYKNDHFNEFSVDELRCPYGQVGDQLWVRETFSNTEYRTAYKADQDDGIHCLVKKWAPSIHMPRWASRIQLEITDIRVERLNDISEEDAIAEGVEIKVKRIVKPYSYPIQYVPIAPVDWYKDLWEQINGADSWNANPWVWAINFRRIDNE